MNINSETLNENQLKCLEPNLIEFTNIAVEGLIFNDDSELILQKRGNSCRDEVGKYEGIGGRVHKDECFRNALKREILEEVGSNLKIEIVDYVGFKIIESFDIVKNINKKWIVLVYHCILKAGKLEIKEPNKNEGYLTLNIDDYINGNVNKKKLSDSICISLDWIVEKLQKKEK